MILLPLRPASLTHKNPQIRKIIHGMRPVGRKDRSIDLNMCIAEVSGPFVLFLWQLLWLLFNDAFNNNNNNNKP